MESKDFLKDIYEDFFGIEKIKMENEKLRQELNLTEDYPTIEVNREETSLAPERTITKEEKDNQMKNFFEKIEELYITEDSKTTLKKMIEYLRKYQEGLEKQYIPFNMCIYSDDKETIYQMVEIINDAMMYFSYIKRGDLIETSLYHLEKVEEIEQIYGEQNSIIVLKDFEGFIAQDQIFKDKFLHRLAEKMAEQNNFLTILVAKNKEVLAQAFEKNEEIKEHLFEFEIIGIKPDSQDVYQEVLEKLKESSEVSEEVSVALLDYIAATYPKTTLSYPEYRDKLCGKILFNKKGSITKEDIPEYEKEKSMDEIFEELNSLVGLTKVKQTLQDLVSLIELRNKTKDDLKIKNTNLHMVFLGNPGTGKTTVARLIVQILYHLGYIQQNKLIEVSSKDLVAEYVGQTAPKTMAVVEKAMGGVLFIDEAYSLASGNGKGNSYNEEAIATLIQAMENHRDNLVVIFAGYTKEMQAFLDSNSGIVSRIGYTLEFEDYTEEELLQIFKQMVTKSGFDITKEALDKALKIIKEYKDSKNFGNARFARNLYEKTIIKHASNTKGKKLKKLLKTIQEEDISVENLLK
ncbi:MAG: AAA family ATPase [Clostridia bacterium]|nr:AAA family ATPase [Clostridia bacterium]